MLVRNLTKSELRLRCGATVIALPPRKIVNVDEVKFPAETIKNIYGKYVQIMADEDNKVEVVKDENPTETKAPVESEEADGNVPEDNAGDAKDSEGEAADDATADADVVVEDPANNGDGADETDVTGNEADEAEVGEGKTEEDNKKSTSKKAAKKAGKKNK